MRIQSIQAEQAHIPLTRPYEISCETHDSIEMFFVKVMTKNGTVGYGSGTPSPRVVGETLQDSLDAISLIDTELQGQDLRELPFLVRKLKSLIPKATAAQAALDMAFHDALTKHLDIPLCRYLGAAHSKIPTSITIGIMGVEETLAEASEYTSRGFRVLKVKIGRNLEEDVERLRKLRETTKSETMIYVDPNQGYSISDLKGFITKTQNLNIEFTEQPCLPEQDDALATLPREIRQKLAADESLHSSADAFRLSAKLESFGIFNIKLMKCGGITEAIKIAGCAELAKIPLMWGCMDESCVSIAAALHAAFSAPNTKYLDLDGSFDLARDPFKGGFVLEDGYMKTLNKPGLGVEET